MFLKNIVAALAAATLAGAAFAVPAPIPVSGGTGTAGSFVDGDLGNFGPLTHAAGSSFTDVINFNVDQLSYLTGSLTSASQYTFSSVVLKDSLGHVMADADTTVKGWDYSYLTAGSYSFNVAGHVAPGVARQYSGQFNVSAVPEPESYALFLAGLGALGFMSRRRKTS